mmetsp:Transcript_1458/g.3170  ORF Transcript_1458/g.3170 Transcript_1458/m.3170 type:complete len:514 (-) Transcript_1458:224-1765(-)|eukprot:CAMPEP_0171103104 /NCGR_PEP_ID=MMETSP0766_2-20121228/58735_1 /TAXON_ID=439317 /ORGANISM="Gambierdiscus australes, Strain CAWD 149" /LENGTH=513 /DNA_ID=CAMNT_0011563505 /DNA_START=61 /DNA_END=1602 /DNA_ORIENTATION=+
MDKPMMETTAGLEVRESMIYLVFLTMFLDVISACISTPVMPYYAQSFGVPVAWIGYLYAAWSFSATVFAPMLSSMADKWGRKKVLVCCLVGAGLANVIQGMALYFGHIGFGVFLFGRTFSGCWASVGATCNVYITDVATSDTLRQKYLANLSLVPLVAVAVGPGLGGGLAAAFGNNIPVLVDGLITLFSACVVSVNLEETPAFLRSKMGSESSKEAQEAQTPEQAVTVPRGVYVVGLATLLVTIAMQSNLSTYALFYQKEYGFTTLYVGFLFMGSAVVMILTNMLIVSQMRKRMKPVQMWFVGSLINGVGSVALGFSGPLRRLRVTLACQYIGGIGSGISSPQSGAIIASFTTVKNRGKIFGINQTFQNFGRIIGPILGTHLAVHGVPGVSDGFMGLPFITAGGFIVVSSGIMLISMRFAPKAPEKPLERKATAFGTKWHDEVGEAEDVLALGKYVAGLLSSRHYKWVTRRAEIEKLLDDLLPELKVETRESYEDSFNMWKVRTQAATVANVA